MATSAGLPLSPMLAQLFVKLPDGCLQTLQATELRPVGDIKAAFSELSGMRACIQILSRSGNIVEDLQLLCHLRIKDSGTMELQSKTPVSPKRTGKRSERYG